jgi:serine/arginine repetitive matrix protein 2
MEAPYMRVASPPPNLATGRGSSLGPVGPAQSRRSGQRHSSLSNVQEHGFDRPGSRGSVNFSLPTSLRPGSPPPSPVTQTRLTSPSPLRTKPAVITSPTNQSLVYDPHTRSFLPRANILAIEQRLVDASTAPVQKKKRIASQQATGSHLADGTVGGRLKGSAIDAMQSSPAQASKPIQSTQSTASKPERIASPEPIREVRQKRRQRKEVVYDSDSDQASYIPNSSDNESDYASQPSTFNTRAGALLAKKPSIVREDREREEEEDSTPVKATQALSRIEDSPVARTTSPTPLPRSSAGRGHGRGQASASAAYAEGRQHTRSASQPAPTLQESLEGNGLSALSAKDSVRGSRVQSVSPARTTHFASAPDSLMVKHTPPARSISPRKSALKSPRGVSPNPESVGFSNASNQSEASDDLQVPKKKGVRVSFDEANVAVGQAAPLVSTDSPLVASPQARRSWFSIGRGKKKESSMTDEDDEVMKPRPALPSFGSVREKKPARDSTPERPLIKPTMPEDAVTSPLFTSPTGDSFEYPLGISNDHVVGTVLSQDASMKNAANISKSREPLPPQVTSVEGNGYLSDSSSIASQEDSKNSTAVDESTLPGQAVSAPIHVDTAKAATSEIPMAESLDFAETLGGVPGIAITTATPTVDKGEWLDMPGGWRQANSDTSSSQDHDEMSIVQHQATDPTPGEIGIAEPTPDVVHSGSPVIGNIAAENSRHSTILEESDTSENDSIYSDAAEDLSDVDGDGFMSLDAVVESPIVPSSGADTALTTPPDTPTSKATKERAYRQSGLVRRESEPDADQGWEKAQEYWKSLSVDKKKQIEEEARIGSEESERGIDLQHSPKPKKKKTQNATRVASPKVPEIRQPVPNNQRTYMIAPGTKHGQESTALRSSMRAEPQAPPAETHIRKSMRGDGSMRGSLRGPAEPEKVLPMRSSLRNSVSPVESRSMRGPQRDSTSSNEPRGALQKKHRPISQGPQEIRPDPAAVDAMVKKLSASKASSTPMSAKRMTAPAGPTLRRRGSADSDSSFKRVRVSNDIPSFKTSMRGSRDDGARAKSPTGSSRFSLRTMSPTPSTHRRAFSSSAASAPPLPQTHMRNSMRNSVGAAPTLRGAPTRTKSPLRVPGFGRSFGTDKAPPKRKPIGQRSSRFDDSSDEEETRPSFRSRFNDSSDEDDEPAPPRNGGMAAKSMRSNVPVRGIPKRAGAEDGDSSDLPDSDDEKPVRKPNGVATKQPPVSMEGGALASGSLRRSGSGRGNMSPITTTPIRPDNNRRGSFMSILRRKKDPSSKVRKSDLESPARRDTPLERSKSDLATLKAADRPTSPRLQKRNPMSRQNSGAWPIVPPPVFGIEEGRPFTADAADGVIGAESKDMEGGRPSLGSRRHTASGLTGLDLTVANGNEIGTPTKKKKKFQALRKMFRLDD